MPAREESGMEGHAGGQGRGAENAERHTPWGVAAVPVARQDGEGRRVP